jgi:hypothetical protein
VADLTSTRPFGRESRSLASADGGFHAYLWEPWKGGMHRSGRIRGHGVLLEGAVQQGGGVTVRWPRFAVCHLRILSSVWES